MAKKAVKTEEQEQTPIEETPAEAPVIAKSDSDAAISSETEQTADNVDETAANSETAEPKEDEAATENEMTEPDKTAYTVSGCNIRHDGKTYKEGSKIELTDEEAARLMKYLR